jgi:hypothetical protein
MHDGPRATDARLAAAIRALLPRRREPPAVDDMPARLEYLERDVREVRTRVNALFFTVIGVAVSDLASRLVLP